MLGEKLLHSALKYYIDPDETHHEIGIGGYFADILNEDGIFEIQTGSMHPLAAKLRAYPDEYQVTVVCPLIVEKRVFWIDPVSGEISGGRKSPRHGQICDVFGELIHIRNSMRRAQLRIIGLKGDEYRLLTGRSPDLKRWGAVRFERVPTELLWERELCTAEDYIALLPDIAEPFTVRTLANGLKIGYNIAGAMARTLFDMGVLQRVGKEKNAYLYAKK